MTKGEKKAYRKGRKDGFDHGLNVAKMIYTAVVEDLIRQREELNNELIMGKEEDDGNTD